MDKVYIASPLFTTEDNATLDKVEALLSSHGINFFSPRKGEASVNFGAAKTREERSALARGVFDENIHHLSQCSMVLVNVDSTTFIDKNSRSTDVGTAFEMGYIYGRKMYDQSGVDEGRKVKVVSFSSKGFGMNIMLQFASDCHLTSIEAVDQFFGQLANGSNYESLCKEMDNKNGDTY